MKPLHNQIDKRLLKQQQVALKSRITLSFYKYFQIADPASLRDSLYSLWDSMRVLGRVYIAPEGINAQVSVDTSMFEIFKRSLNETGFLRNIRLNVAIEDNGNSFFVLKVQVKKKIVADGLRDFRVRAERKAHTRLGANELWVRPHAFSIHTVTECALLREDG